VNTGLIQSCSRECELGMALNVKLLGVSPDTEAEADQLGIQYLWRAGYDPRGFIEFFDKMAGEASSVRTISFFHAHPAYPDAIPIKRDAKADSQRFHEIQKTVQRRMHEVRGTASEESLAGCEDRGALRRTRLDERLQ
jgi:predicted Zn-dependent protease